MIAYEPNLHMHGRLTESARRHGIDLDLRPAGAETLAEETGSLEMVVSTLTLCSVDDPQRVLAEIRRVLRPGGRFVFVEHVVAPKGSATRLAQTLLSPAWSAVSDRCRLLARTHELIAEAGFASVSYDVENLGPRLDPSRRTAFGVAVR